MILVLNSSSSRACYSTAHDPLANQLIICPLGVVEVWRTLPDASAMMAAHHLLSSAMRSRDDSDWPVHSLMFCHLTLNQILYIFLNQLSFEVWQPLLSLISVVMSVFLPLQPDQIVGTVPTDEAPPNGESSDNTKPTAADGWSKTDDGVGDASPRVDFNEELLRMTPYVNTLICSG